MSGRLHALALGWKKTVLTPRKSVQGQIQHLRTQNARHSGDRQAAQVDERQDNLSAAPCDTLGFFEISDSIPSAQMGADGKNTTKSALLSRS